MKNIDSADSFAFGVVVGALLCVLGICIASLMAQCSTI